MGTALIKIESVTTQEEMVVRRSRECPTETGLVSNQVVLRSRWSL